MARSIRDPTQGTCTFGGPAFQSPSPDLNPSPCTDAHLSSPLPPLPRIEASGGADNQQPPPAGGRRAGSSASEALPALHARPSPRAAAPRQQLPLSWFLARPRRTASPPAFAADGRIPSPPLQRRHVAPPESLPPSAPRCLLATIPHPSPIVPVPPSLPPFSTSTSTTVPTAPFSLEDYLVASCGLAPTQARDVSKKLSRELLSKSNGSRRSLDELSYSRLNSASNPDAILALLSSAGLSRAEIAAVVSADPLLLRTSVKNLAPRLAALRDRVGLSTPQITRFLLVASRALRGGDVTPRLEFFISFYGSFDRVLAAAKRNWGLLSASLERIIKANIALFCQRGVPDVAKVCLQNPWMLTFNSERVKEVLLRAEELGVPAASPVFGQAVAVVSSASREKVAAKLEFFKRTLGCSETELSIAVSKMPSILGLSDATLLRKIEFLINEAAMEPQYIMERPILLAFSLEKRLVPRHHVMKVLQEKGLLDSNMKLFSLAHLGEEAFKSKFIDCYKDSVPGLADAYAAASARIVPSRV